MQPSNGSKMRTTRKRDAAFWAAFLFCIINQTKSINTMININQQEFETLRDAVSTFGSEAQLRQLQEECGELIAAINHLSRGRVNAGVEFMSEFVDVYIVMAQLFIAMKNPTEFKNLFKVKLYNLEQKVKEVKSHE